MKILLPLAIFLCATAAPAIASDPQFSGQTTVKGILRDDILRTALMADLVVILDQNPKFECRSINSVHTKVVDESSVPAASRISAKDAGYEIWDLDLCGRVDSVVIALSHAKDGGTDFSVNYLRPSTATVK